MSKNGAKLNKGFTLIELIVSVALFIVVMTVATGAIFGIFNNNFKIKNQKTTLSNLNTALESMSREIRFGSVYHCDSTGTLTLPQDCPAGAQYFVFQSSDGKQIRYRRGNQALEKSVDGGSWIRVTGPEIIIQTLNFFTLGSSPTDNLQPKTLIIIRGTVGTGSQKAVTRFTLQTLVSQRVIDRP